MRFASSLLLALAAPALAADPTIAITGPISSSTQKTTFTLKGTAANYPAGGAISVTIGQVVNGTEEKVKGGVYTTTVNAKTGTWSVDITLPVGTGYTLYAILDNTSNPIQFDEIYDITVAAPVPNACTSLADDISLNITYPLAGATFKLGTTPNVITSSVLDNGTTSWCYLEIEDTANYYYGDAWQVWSGMNPHWTLPNALPVLTSDAQGTATSITFSIVL